MKGRDLTQCGFALACLSALAVLLLFEALFLDSTALGLDLRIFPPFHCLVDASEPARWMNLTCLDAAAWLMPDKMVQLGRLSAGELPLWNPHQGMGQPHLATLGYTPFYPAALFDLVLSPLRALAVSNAVHLIGLGFGTFVAQRRHGLGLAAALLGAMCMQMCAYVTVHLHTPIMVHSIAWTPWLLIGLERLIARPTGRRAATLAILSGCCLLAGFPQTSLLAIYAVSGLCLPALIAAPGGSRLRIVVLAVIAFAIGGALSCVQLIPAVELLGESWRAGGWSTEVLQSKSLAPQSWICSLLPHFFGTPVQLIAAASPDPRIAWEFPSYLAWQTFEVQNNFEENSVWVGLVPLVLALSALLHRPLRPGRWTILLVLTALAAMGTAGLTDVLGVLPGLASGSPKRALFLTAFAISWLAARAMQRIVEANNSQRQILLIGAGLALTSIGVVSLLLPFESWLLPNTSPPDAAWFRATLLPDLVACLGIGVVLLLAAGLLGRGRRMVAVVVLILAAGVELLAFARDCNPPQPMRGQYETTKGIEWLREHDASTSVRYLSFDANELLPGSVGQLFGLRSCNAMASMLPRRVGELMRAVEPGCLRLDNPCLLGTLRETGSLSSPLLDLLGVRYVVASTSGYLRIQSQLDQLPGLQRVYLDEQEALAIYQRPHPAPPAFCVEELRVLPDPEQRLAWLATASFEPTKQAVVASPPLGVPLQGLANGQVSYQRASPERIEIQVDCAGPAFLVISETAFPGWFATIDGASVPLVTADHGLMGVALPRAGKHEVVLLYAPGSWWLGVLGSLLGIVICGLLVFCGRRLGVADHG